MSKHLLGHIDCPTCGGAGTMRVTTDKNGEPFGFCKDGCRQQLRVGGDPDRVHDFYKAHPGIKKPGAPVTETVPEKPAAPAPAAKQAAPVTVTAPAPAPAPAKPVRKPAANPFDFLINPKGGTT